ncbi:MFS transporter, partial [Pseudomonas aeruginosa]|uniref:MFS transporter n=1 Tax=Pseudomonas aeruginosa TaxID=287 RepID=UPI001CA4C5E6
AYEIHERLVGSEMCIRDRCLASLALARSGWQLYLLFALLGLLTPGNIPYARILGGWFERRRGAAYGILGLGFGVGGPLALYLGSACIDAFGWRATFLVYGLLEGLLALPLLYALFRELSLIHISEPTRRS